MHLTSFYNMVIFVNRTIVDHVNFKPPLIDCLTGLDITTADYRLMSLGWAFFDILRVPFDLTDILFIGEIIFIFFFLEVGFLC